MAHIILLKGRGEKSFCAGGDVAALALQNDTPAGVKDSIEYFAEEYKLDHLIAASKSIVVSFLDGITMGGGCGLSMHSPFRIVTERTLFAMPETSIGLFPDVGASFFLSRLDGAIGTYLALTGARLKSGDLLNVGLASHYLHSSSLPAVEARLAELNFASNLDTATKMAIVNQTLAEYVSEAPPAATIVGELRTVIDFAFSVSSVPEILERLDAIAKSEAPSESTRKWANDTKATLLTYSPTSLHATLRLLRLGPTWTLAEAFVREHGLASHFMSSVADFGIGVKAKLISKPAQPAVWKGDIQSINTETVDALFEDVSPKLQLLNDRERNTTDYAWRNKVGVPNEAYIKKVVDSYGVDGREVIIEKVVRDFAAAQGCREKVTDVVTRKTKEKANGGVEWAA
jgi:3-hydroxyisobutyryl-CoA hydrolase